VMESSELEAVMDEGTTLADEIETMEDDLPVAELEVVVDSMDTAVDVLDEVEAVGVLEDDDPSDTESIMQQPTTLLTPIRGVLKPLTEEEPVRTARLTPVGHMLVPEKKRGPPPTSKPMKAPTATLRPVRGKLTPLTKPGVKRLTPSSDEEE